MNIRAIPLHDLDALLALYRHLHAADDPPPEREVVNGVWQELISSPRQSVLGGYVGAELVSSCVLSVIPNLTRAGRPYGVMENVVTHTEHRNRGYGKAILAHALALAWSERCYKVMLLTGRKDDATFQFYESAGFSRHDKQAFVARPPA